MRPRGSFGLSVTDTASLDAVKAVEFGNKLAMWPSSATPSSAMSGCPIEANCSANFSAPRCGPSSAGMP